MSKGTLKLTQYLYFPHHKHWFYHKYVAHHKGITRAGQGNNILFCHHLRQPHLEWENKKCCKQRSELGSEPQTRTTEQNSNGKAESIVVPESS